jgi:hypothetical protein
MLADQACARPEETGGHERFQMSGAPLAAARLA